MSVTLENIREDLKDMLETDENLRYVDVLADTLDDALADAAVQLDTKVSMIEYEVLERGSKGILGLIKKNWKIRAYEIAGESKKSNKNKFDDIIVEDETEEVVESVDKDGEYFIRKFDAQINLKVNLPIGKGDEVDSKQVISEIKAMPEFQSVEEAEVKNACKNGTNGVYVPVGTFKHNLANDSTIVIDISSDDMHALATVTMPSNFGADISPEAIKKNLEVQGVLAGIEDDKIYEFVDHPIYGEPYEIVTAPSAVDGKNAYIQYKFETDSSKLRIKESKTGQVDFKELNRIQNVIKGQPLAVKIPPEKGKAGKTLKGRYLEAKNGKDIPLPLGKNVEVDSDGVTILAQINGQVLLIGDKISVEPVMEVENVGIKTGNISFLGTVIVKGSVDDTFNIKASGDIIVSGTVGKCILEADGNVVVSQGVMGRDEGSIKAGRSLWAKFIQNTKVDVEEYVIVTDAIMNSNITCNKKIIVEGKRATIIGGHIYATEAVYSKNIGSAGGGSETIIEVGMDPKAKLRTLEIRDIQSKLNKELDELDLNITNLENTKKVRKRLPHDKELLLEELTQRKNEILTQTDDLKAELTQIQDHLRELKSVGKVSASGTVYSGVKIYVRDLKDDVRADIKGVCFFYEGNVIRRGKYEAPSEDDMKKVTNGYSSN